MRAPSLRGPTDGTPGGGAGAVRDDGAVSAPVVPVAPAVLADLLLAADGLRPREVLVPVDAATADAALAADRLLVHDDEGVPVVTLTGLTRVADGVRGTAAAGPGTSRAPGHDRRVPPPEARHGRTAVVVERPLHPREEDAVAAEVAAGRQVVLVVPVAGPSRDGLPVTALLTLADATAARTGAVVLGATLSGPNAGPAAAASLGADLRTAGADDPAWRALVDAYRGTGSSDLPAAPGVHDLLAARFPPPARRGVVVLLTGLSGSGKSTIARHLVDRVEARGRRTSLLDGDHVRTVLSAGLGFSREDRERNVLRIGYVAAQVARHGGVAVCAPIAPYAATRDAVRRLVEAEGGDLVLVHVSTPLAECERRDVKGLYARARAGEVPLFTGVSDPYEEPDDADVAVDTSDLTEAQATDRVLALLRDRAYLPASG